MLSEMSFFRAAESTGVECAHREAYLAQQNLFNDDTAVQQLLLQLLLDLREFNQVSQERQAGDARWTACNPADR